MDENTRSKIRHACVEMRIVKTLAFWGLPQAVTDSVSVRFENARVDKTLLNIHMP